MRIICNIALAFGLGLTAAASQAEAPYPSRPVRLVVPWPAGGGSDQTARIVAKALQERLGQAVIVDNKPGAAGNIGTRMVVDAPADGLTWLYSSGPFSVNPSLYRTLPFDTERDFAPVGQIGTTPSVVVVSPDFGARNLEALIAKAKNPEQPVVYFSPGNGSAQHLAMELLRKRAGLSLTHVPYKGAAPALVDLLGGQAALMISGLPEVLPYIRSGQLLPLAVTSAERVNLIANVPTLMELGLADNATAGWSGLHVKAGTPQPVIQKLSAELRAVLASPQVAELLRARGTEVHAGTPGEFGAFVHQQVLSWGTAVELSGAKVD